MKNVCFLVLTVLLFLTGCSTNPNKAEKIQTNIENQESVGGGATLGTNDKGEMVVQRKVRLATYLKDLQTEVYTMENLIYGDEDTGRKGLYGVLRDCRDTVRAKKLGGDGKIAPPPKKDIKTRGEDMSITAMLDKLQSGKVGKDEQKQLVAVTEDYLLDRIKRFENYKDSYYERKDWFAEEVRKCKAEVKEKEPAIVAEAKAIEVSTAKPNDQDLYLCNYVEKNASMKDLLMVAMQRGWLSKNALAESRFINPGSSKDATGYDRPYVMKIGSWALAFDHYANFGELMNEGEDAKLEAWSHPSKEQIPGSGKCLGRENGWWNTQRSFE